MRGAVIVLYFAGFLLEETYGNATYTAQPKIIGGQSIDIRYRPFMLSLHNSYGFLCGASILSSTWAITALHCLISVPSSQYYVRAGSNKMDRGGSVHRVTNIRVYNDTYRSWFLRLFYHDIALLEVKPPFHFSKTIKPVHLPRSSHELPFELLVCGWGYINDKKVKNAETLMGVYVQHIPYETCINITSLYATLVKDDYHLCYGTQGKDACFGDSGGALASRRTIYGIVSFGHGCGKVAGVYVKVFYYREWIKSVINL
ncbi:PREDICTED: trypsin delta/gamma-like [Atta cephalotes]|uniref:trypsin n=1 Tax=Atta cephalotes TaxID=12957 RepID=A0A158NYS0_ATTCE|nr:PREDICTED: trypsin delta/gamma-like [Atta cephalotes]